jgi:GT2 family glycosyltransferase
LAHPWQLPVEVEHRTNDSGELAPEVSVVITTSRREHLLPETIASVRSQDGVHSELVVIDESPQGSARDVVNAAGPGVRYVRRDLAAAADGRESSRNDAFASCRAPFVHFLEGDDLLAEGALARLHAALSRADAGMAFGRVAPFGEDADIVHKVAEHFEKAAARAKWLRGRHVFAAHLLFLESLLVGSACLVRREAFEEARGCDGSLGRFEDVDLCLRIGRRCGVVFIDEDVVQYRVDDDPHRQDVPARSNRPLIPAGHEVIRRRYRERHGDLEYRVLQVFALGARRVGLA